MTLHKQYLIDKVITLKTFDFLNVKIIELKSF